MNRNNKILEFEYNGDYDAYKGITQVHDLTYAPLSLFYCDNNDLNKVFYKWLKKRGIPESRDNLKYLCYFVYFN